MDKLEKVEAIDDTHGVAGHDVADFVSMQKLRRHNQAKMAVYIWLALIVICGGVTMYYKQITQNTIERASDYRDNEELYERILSEQSGLCFRVYDRFLGAGDVNQQSEFVVDGVSKLLKMENYNQGVLRFSPQVPISILDSKYTEDGKYPRVELLCQDAISRTFEVVFWKTEKGWKMDWEQYVRFSENSWNEFLVNQEGSEDFRLYVRRRYSNNDEAMQLLFYEPTEEAGVKITESPQVRLESNNPMYHKLIGAFKKKDLTAEEASAFVVGKKDAPGFVRVNARLGFKEGAEGKPELQLEKIHALHWMEFEPEVN